MNIVEGGTGCEFFALVSSGDVLNARYLLREVKEKEGKTGAILVVTTETEFTRQNGDLIALEYRDIICRR